MYSRFSFATGVWFNNSATEGFVHTGTKQVCEHVDNEGRGQNQLMIGTGSINTNTGFRAWSGELIKEQVWACMNELEHHLFSSTVSAYRTKGQ